MSTKGFFKEFNKKIEPKQKLIPGEKLKFEGKVYTLKKVANKYDKVQKFDSDKYAKNLIDSFNEGKGFFGSEKFIVLAAAGKTIVRMIDEQDDKYHTFKESKVSKESGKLVFEGVMNEVFVNIMYRYQDCKLEENFEDNSITAIGPVSRLKELEKELRDIDMKIYEVDYNLSPMSGSDELMGIGIPGKKGIKQESNYVLSFAKVKNVVPIRYCLSKLKKIGHIQGFKKTEKGVLLNNVKRVEYVKRVLDKLFKEIDYNLSPIQGSDELMGLNEATIIIDYIDQDGQECSKTVEAENVRQALEKFMIDNPNAKDAKATLKEKSFRENQLKPAQFCLLPTDFNNLSKYGSTEIARSSYSKNEWENIFNKLDTQINTLDEFMNIDSVVINANLEPKTRLPRPGEEPPTLNQTSVDVNRVPKLTPVEKKKLKETVSKSIKNKVINRLNQEYESILEDDPEWESDSTAFPKKADFDKAKTGVLSATNLKELTDNLDAAFPGGELTDTILMDVGLEVEKKKLKKEQDEDIDEFSDPVAEEPMEPEEDIEEDEILEVNDGDQFIANEDIYRIGKAPEGEIVSKTQLDNYIEQLVAEGQTFIVDNVESSGPEEEIEEDEEEQEDGFSEKTELKRNQISQIRDKEWHAAKKILDNLAIQYKETIAKVSDLKPSQEDFVQEKVDNIYKAIESGEENFTTPVFISEDNFILDGHHRVRAYKKQNENQQIPVVKIILDQYEALQLFKRMEEEGIDYNLSPIQDSDELMGIGHKAKKEGRGQGLGKGGRRQGDGGAITCVCPECGYKEVHKKGEPCNEIKCPKCNVNLIGESKSIKEGEWVKTWVPNGDSFTEWFDKYKTDKNLKTNYQEYKNDMAEMGGEALDFKQWAKTIFDKLTEQIKNQRLKKEGFISKLLGKFYAWHYDKKSYNDLDSVDKKVISIFANNPELIQALGDEKLISIIQRFVDELSGSEYDNNNELEDDDYIELEKRIKKEVGNITAGDEYPVIDRNDIEDKKNDILVEPELLGDDVLGFDDNNELEEVPATYVEISVEGEKVYFSQDQFAELIENEIIEPYDTGESQQALPVNEPGSRVPSDMEEEI